MRSEVRSRFPQGCLEEAWDWCLTAHTAKSAHEINVLSDSDDLENIYKWGSCHAAQCTAGDRILNDWVRLAFFLQCFELNDATGWLLIWFGWRLVIVLECKWKMRHKGLAVVFGVGEILFFVFPEMAGNCGCYDWELGYRPGVSAKVLLNNWLFYGVSSS